MALCSAHTFTDWIVDLCPTTYTAGSKHRDCTVCGYEETAEITAGSNEHNWTYINKDYSKGDNYIDGICFEASQRCSECSVEDNTIVTVNHNVVTNSRGTTCSQCNKNLVERSDGSCDHTYTVNTQGPDDIYCSRSEKVCTKCSEVAETSNVSHNFVTVAIEDDFEYDSKQHCTKCGYDIYHKIGDENMVKPVISITTDSVIKETNNNANKYSLELNIITSFDFEGNPASSENINLEIEIDKEDPNTDYKVLEIENMFGETNPVTYTGSDSNSYTVNYKTHLEAPVLYLDLAGKDASNNLSDTTSLVLDNNFKTEDIPVKPINPDICECKGEYKILLETVPNTATRPANFQYLLDNKDEYKSETIQEGISKYCEELNNYKRTQLTLIKTVNVDLNSELIDKPATEPIEPEDKLLTCGCPYGWVGEAVQWLEDVRFPIDVTPDIDGYGDFRIMFMMNDVEDPWNYVFVSIDEDKLKELENSVEGKFKIAETRPGKSEAYIDCDINYDVVGHKMDLLGYEFTIPEGLVRLYYKPDRDDYIVNSKATVMINVQA